MAQLAADVVLAGRYRVVAHLGSGGMGAVYEVEHLRSGRRLAAKTLLPQVSAVPEVRARFEREAKAATLMDHPNVVEVFDFGRLDDGTLFLVMELVRGTTLGQVLTGGALEARRALGIARQVLGALTHAHYHGVVHRDLKPDNVMLLDGDAVKLVDFGIAKVIGEAAAEVGGGTLTETGVVFGTPEYMAPEQALGRPIDGRVDVYAMGVILYEMLCGRKPFVAADPLALLRMHVGAPAPRLPAGFAAPLADLVARALAKRPEDRFESAGAMLAAVEDVLAS